jgi:hypothetical protein
MRPARIAPAPGQQQAADTMAACTCQADESSANGRRAGGSGWRGVPTLPFALGQSQAGRCQHCVATPCHFGSSGFDSKVRCRIGVA